MVRKIWLALLLAVGALALCAPLSHAAPATWTAVAEEMTTVLEDGWAAFQAGQIAEAKAQVDVAYYSYYEKLGFEAAVMGHVSGQSATDAEYEFNLVKKAMTAGETGEARQHLDTLEDLLAYQAQRLDGVEESAAATLIEALIIILREGFEAIIVLGAIIAYLVKSGHQAKLRPVYAGAVLALAASVALAFAVNAVTALSGANQELTEGVTVLVAMVMLVWVSNWILAKSEAGAWTRYVRSAAEASLSRGSLLSLALVAFLAVFREGAETILLFQALRARADETEQMVWVGLGVGLVVLVGIYLAIRYLSIRIPLRPFFLATSALLAVMAVSFAGSGVNELQEAGVVPITPLPGLPTVDLLGFYPSAETVTAQAVVLTVMAALSAFAIRRARRAAAAPPPSAPARENPSENPSEPSEKVETPS